jgi:hypothetical protein
LLVKLKNVWAGVANLKGAKNMSLLRRISTFAVLAATIPFTLLGQSSQTVSRTEARKAIQDGNIACGKARVAIDKGAFERMLAPDLYVQFSDRRLTRQQFIDRSSSFPRKSAMSSGRARHPLSNW